MNQEEVLKILKETEEKFSNLYTEGIALGLGGKHKESKVKFTEGAKLLVKLPERMGNIININIDPEKKRKNNRVSLILREKSPTSFE